MSEPREHLMVTPAKADAKDLPAAKTATPEGKAADSPRSPDPAQPLADGLMAGIAAPSWKVQIDRAQVLAQELGLRPIQVERTLELLDGGATLPFIARYRKEVTSGLDEVQIATIQERGAYLTELVARKSSILTEIHKQGKLTPALESRIIATLSKTELEDLYLPYKPKRRTRATIAREKGLEPLALCILAQEDSAPSQKELAAPYISIEKGLLDESSVFAGARDIIAEVLSDDANVRAALRAMAMEEGVMRSRLIKRKEEEEDSAPEPGNEKDPAAPRPVKEAKKEDPAAKFTDYFEYEEAVKTIPSHRMLALRRGEKEGVLRVTLELDREAAIAIVSRFAIRNRKAALLHELELAVADAWERLLKPAIEVDVRLALRERADAEAIRVFAENLRHLLLAPPLGGRRVLALDPGYRTGCKLAIIDEKGDLGVHDIIFPTHSESRRSDAATRLEQLITEHKIQAIAIGNGTASRETEGFVRRLASAGKLPGVKVVVVNEAGASVYSTSEVGRQEFPTHDPTVRGAVSIGRRLQDPLAELVKIDPKSIGVGQYQHDVHQPTLKKQLDQVVESCVNQIGVDVNTASPRLLQYVAGIGETLAGNIATYRSEHGPFVSRRQLLDVPRMGPKAFEQAAGFLRIRENGENPLDASAVHPESYDVVEHMAKDLAVAVNELIGNSELVKQIQITRYIDERRGEPTLRDILGELEKPGRDPRKEFEEVGFNPNVTEVSHLQEGMILNGVVTNVTNFGAFVDVGVHQDGLVHVSELAHRFIKDPAEAVKVGDKVKVKVIKVELDRMRIGLSIKAATEAPKADPGDARKGRDASFGQARGRERPEGPRTDAPRGEPAAARGGERPAPGRDRPRPPRRDEGKPGDRPEGRERSGATPAPAAGRRDEPRRDEGHRGRRDEGQRPSGPRPDRDNRDNREGRDNRDNRGGGAGGAAPGKASAPFNTIRGLNFVLKK